MNSRSLINTFVLSSAVALLSACQSLPRKDTPELPAARQAVEEWRQASLPPAVVEPPPEVQRALLPPASTVADNLRPQIPTFDVSVNEVPARQFFMSLVEGTSDNMVVHPEVSGTLTLDLKNVTTAKVMDTVRDVYGYEYRYNNGIYQVFPAQMRSQVFKVNYLDIERAGGSRTRVSSGQVSQSPSQSGGSGSDTGDTPASNADNNNADGRDARNGSFSGAQVTTLSDTNFWNNLQRSLALLIGEEQGRTI
ncbi:MAG: secretin N-terminal domain-containing protein, partial [Gammaproteobacteria bacterium]